MVVSPSVAGPGQQSPGYTVTTNGRRPDRQGMQNFLDFF